MNFDLICDKELGYFGWSVTTPTRERKVSLEQLMGKGADEILKESKYKP